MQSKDSNKSTGQYKSTAQTVTKAQDQTKDPGAVKLHTVQQSLHCMQIIFCHFLGY